MTNLLLQAFAQNINDCTLDAGYPDLPGIIDVKEIDDPRTIPWPAGFIPEDPSKAWSRKDILPERDV